MIRSKRVLFFDEFYQAQEDRLSFFNFAIYNERGCERVSRFVCVDMVGAISGSRHLQVLSCCLLRLNVFTLRALNENESLHDLQGCLVSRANQMFPSIQGAHDTSFRLVISS